MAYGGKGGAGRPLIFWKSAAKPQALSRCTFQARSPLLKRSLWPSPSAAQLSGRAHAPPWCLDGGRPEMECLDLHKLLKQAAMKRQRDLKTKDYYLAHNFNRQGNRQCTSAFTTAFTMTWS